MQPKNETGQPGEDLGSRNFNWGLPLVALPGRGLDLGVGLFYNSLVWTKQGSSVRFNADHGFPGAGFSLGFPKLQQLYHNSIEDAYAYMLVTPSGARLELKRTATANVYEAEDGSYTQLIDNGNGTALLRTSDGTRYWFVASVNNEMRCTEIKDRNGNFITLRYNSLGRPTEAVDTLGRTVFFNYDANNYLTSITQTWDGQSHTWATFSYGLQTIQTDFRDPSGNPLAVQGPANGSQIPVLTQVWLHDGSYSRFSYTPWGQVWKFTHHAPDGGVLSWTGFNVPGSEWLASSAQTDCPRFTERRDWIRMGVRNADAEVVTRYSVAADGSWSQVTLPDDTPADPNDNVVHREYFATSGWLKGLGTQSDTFVAGNPGVIKKRTTVRWTQDDEGLTYQKNPRPAEVNVYDEAGNRRRTTIDYMDGFSLPTHVREYAGADGQTFLRMAVTNHKLDADYVSRRIIGLPYERLVYDGPTGNVVSRAIFYYDWSGAHFSALGPSTQHDSTNYPASFITGRGNLTAVRRYNCQNNTTAYDDGLSVLVRQASHNMAGSAVWSQDAAGHRTNISYADSYSDGNNSRGTLAYPTRLTDPDGYSSTVQYNYSTGLVTRTQDPKGAVQTTQYDSAGRILRASVMLNGAEFAHKRWVYQPSLMHLVTAQTAQSNDLEFFAEEHYDGWGRVRAASVEHPGSIGGNSGTFVMYDSGGRLISSADPIEINSGWVPTGDDAATGWRWTTQEYDWQNRPTKRIKPDGWTSELSYSGCGCAGGEVVTSRDERGRRRKLYKDALGRLAKVEELNYDGSVYTTARYSFNSLDLLTGIRHYQGAETSGVFQDRTLGYDGHGRVVSRTTPEQGTTTYAYNLDDTLLTATDARGAAATFGYNNRHLPTSITYGVPSGVASTPNVSFEYDAAGNRTRMNDGAGHVIYAYDTLSRLTSEARYFAELNASYTLTYGYNAGGQLTSFTNPWGAQVGYTRNLTGMVTGVTGANYAGVSTYASGIQYRAHGGVKAMTYGNGRTLSAGYDNLGRLKRWDVSGVQGYEYAYSTYYPEQTGRVMFADNLYDARLDRSYDYDQVGRLIVSYSGADARAHAYTGQWGGSDGPYGQSYNHDAFGNVTQRQGWGGENASYTASFDGRNRRAGHQYDAAGNLTGDGFNTYTYDATGQQASAPAPGYSLQNSYDGDRLRVKRVENGATVYYVRSTALGGQVVAELNHVGGWQRGYVYGEGGWLLALQQGGVYWAHQDPYTKSQRLTDASGAVTAALELDPWGGMAGGTWSWNTAQQPRQYTTYERDANGADEAMHRRYNRWLSRFDQPGPWDGSYDLSNPQSFNRYAYVHNDPVNLIDPTGLSYADTMYPDVREWVTDASQHGPSGRNQWANHNAYLEAHTREWVNRFLIDRRARLERPGYLYTYDDFFDFLGRFPEPTFPQGGRFIKGPCGVNPVIGRPGFTRDPIGQTGHLRDPQGGRGEFGAPRISNPNGHQGLDIAGRLNSTPVVAFLAGTVRFAGHTRGDGGTLVEIDHGGGMVSGYVHLQRGSIPDGVRIGQRVEQGQRMGTLGNSGNAGRTPPHLHFRISVNGRNVDPEQILNRGCLQF